MAKETHETPNEDGEGLAEPWLEVSWRVTRLDDDFPGGLYVEDHGHAFVIREVGRSGPGAISVEIPYDEASLLIEALQAAVRYREETK